MSDPDHLEGKIVYCLVEMPQCPDSDEYLLTLSVSPLDYWQEEGCCADWTPHEVFDALKEMGHQGAELMEAMIEFYEPVDIEHIRQHIEQHPLFVFDQDFSDFMERCGEA